MLFLAFRHFAPVEVVVPPAAGLAPGWFDCEPPCGAPVTGSLSLGLSDLNRVSNTSPSLVVAAFENMPTMAATETTPKGFSSEALALEPVVIARTPPRTAA